MYFIKNWLFFLVVFTVSNMASAAWTVAHTNGQNKNAVYIDYATIRKEGSNRRVWQVTDFPEAANGSVRSVQSRIEYDCVNERFKHLSFSTHTGPFGSGQTIESIEGKGSWSEIPPGTMWDAILKIVCSK